MFSFIICFRRGFPKLNSKLETVVAINAWKNPCYHVVINEIGNQYINIISVKLCAELICPLISQLYKYQSTSPKLLKLNQDHPSKKLFFWSNIYKVQVMISFLEMLELPNFRHITTSTLLFELREKGFVSDVKSRNNDIINF